MQTFGSCCAGLGLVSVASAYYMPSGLDDLVVLIGVILVPFGLIAAVLGRKPNQPV